MPRPTDANRAFNPALCPLLHGLTPEEQRQRMETDPLIRACRQAVEAGAEHPAGCADAVVEPKAAAMPRRKGSRTRIPAGA